MQHRRSRRRGAAGVLTLLLPQSHALLLTLLLLLLPCHACWPGGRAVLDTMEKQLSLSQELMEPSRAGLYRFGNVSSTSIWCACWPASSRVLTARRAQPMDRQGVRA